MSADNDPPDEDDRRDEEDDESDHAPSTLERVKMLLEIVVMIVRLLGM